MKRKDVITFLTNIYDKKYISNFIIINNVLDIYKFPDINPKTYIIPVYTKYIDFSHMSLYYYDINNKILYYIDPNNNKFRENIDKYIIKKTNWKINKKVIVPSYSKYECVNVCLNILLYIVNNGKSNI